MSHGAVKLKPEQNQGFAVTSPGEARLYSVIQAEEGDVFLETEGGETFPVPADQRTFQALFRGAVQIEDATLADLTLPTTVTIPPDAIKEVAKDFNLTPEQLKDILSNMGPGQKYDLMARKAEAKVSQAIQGGALARFLRSAKGKAWFMNKRTAIEHLMLKGVPLSVTMASLLGVGELVDMAGIDDPVVSFILVVKGAEFASTPVNVAMRHLYDRGVLKRPFDLALKRFVVQDAAGKAAGDLLANLPVKVGMGSKIGAAFLKELVPSGGTYLAKAGSVVTWPARTLYGMGEGLIFTNLYDAFLKDHVKKGLGGGVASFGGFAAFFGRQVGDFFSGGYLSKGLGLPVARQLLGGAASFVGAGFASFLLDSYVVAPLEYGKRHADYMISVSIRAADELFEHNWVSKSFKAIAGSGITGHLCSGRWIAIFMDLADDVWIGYGRKTKYETCAYARKAIREQDAAMMRDQSVVLKSRFRDALILDGGKEAGIEDWKKRIGDGWFDRVDISPVQTTTSRLFEPVIFQVLELAKLFDTSESDEIVSFLSDEFLEHKNEHEVEEERKKTELAMLPLRMTIIPNEKRDDFLGWLGGENDILSERRKEFYLKLLWADVRRVAGSAGEDDKKLLDLGLEAGFAVRFKGEKGLAMGDYDFSHSAEYYEALAEIVQKAVVDSDVGVKSRLQAYSRQRYRMFITVANSHSFQCAEDGGGEAEEAALVAPYVHDLQMLDPLLIDPNNEIAVPVQENFLEKYLAVLPRDLGFEHAMDEYAKRWEIYIKARIGENIAVRKILGVQYTAGCQTKESCIDKKYSGVEFDSLAYFTEEDFGMGSDLHACLADEALDRTLVGMPAMIRAFYNYAVLGSHAPESVAKGVIGENGRLLDRNEFARWVARPARLAYERITGSTALSPEDKKGWEEKAAQDLAERLKNTKMLLARKWLTAVGERAEDPGREMRELLNEYIEGPDNIEIRRELGLIAAYAKVFEREFLKKMGVVRAFSDFWKIGRAEEFVRLIETGIVTSDGRLGEIQAIEAWIKDDVIEMADKLMEDKKYAHAEQVIEFGEGEIAAKEVELEAEMKKYLKSAKRRKGDVELIARIAILENSIRKDEKGLERIRRYKLEIDAIKAEAARLKELPSK